MMRTRKPRHGAWAVEALEPRSLLAGNVLVGNVAGALTITGDDRSNAIEITQLGPGRYRVRGLPDGAGLATRVNGGASFVVLGVVNDFVINMRRGDDYVFVRGDPLALTVPRHLRMTTVQGRDNIVIQDSTIRGTASIDTGVDNDRVQFIRSRVMGATSVVTHSGNDLVGMFTSRFDATVTVDTGDGDDNVLFGDRGPGLVGSEFRGTVSVLLGIGTDHFETSRSRYARSVRVLGLLGRDDLEAFDSIFLSTITYDGGADLDRLDADVVAGPPVNGNTYTVAPTVLLIETIVS